MTSMPASRRARAMIFAPRSCPSRPGFATTTRILRAVEVAGIALCAADQPAAKGAKSNDRSAAPAEPRGRESSADRDRHRHAWVDRADEPVCPGACEPLRIVAAGLRT